jgi:IS605 OrfB family transposase
LADCTSGSGDCQREGKAIVVENLEKIPKGKRGDGMPKLRQKLQKWIYKGLLEKIEVVGKREGVQVIKVSPAYTSIIGKLKYSPMLGIDKDIAGAYVIARRGLGFKESLPKNYRKLLEDKEFLSYSVARVEDRIAKLKKEIEEEKNKYKRNKLRSELRRLKRELKLLLKFLLDSGKSEPATQQAVNREMKPMRGRAKSLQKSWRVLSVALALSCLESFRDFSPLKRVILLGDWVGVAGRVSPSAWSGDGCTKYVQFYTLWVTRQEPSPGPFIDKLPCRRSFELELPLVLGQLHHRQGRATWYWHRLPRGAV